MAIRFQCGSCAQPIEVDDEWASKTVACPFCRNTINAPIASTIADPSEVHVASPLGTDAESGYVPAHRHAPPRPSRNRIAIVAFALACALLLLLVANVAISAPHSLELADMQEQFLKAAEEGKSPWAVMPEYLNDRGGEMPGWLVGLTIVGVTMMGVWIGAVVCGIIGVLRPARRRLAVTALIICGGFVVQGCLGLLFG